MTIMSDKWIAEQAIHNLLLTPFHNVSRNTLENGVPVTSYGLSSYGYDLRLGDSFKLFNYSSNPEDELLVKPPFYIAYKDKNIERGMDEKVVKIKSSTNNNNSNYYIDPVDFNSELTTSLTGVESILIPPKSFLLGVSQERIKMGRDYTGVCMEKSTLARCGLCVTVTPIEPEWEGFLTLEISNKTDLPIKLTTGMGICQLLFIKGNEPCLTSYKDRQGKYQDQPSSPVLPMAGGVHNTTHAYIPDGAFTIPEGGIR